MRLAEQFDDDAPEIESGDMEPADNSSSAQQFKENYKKFYSDVKTDLSEDW